MADSSMRVLPEEMRGVAGDVGRLGGEADQVRGHLQGGWGRLDAGWQSYAKGNVEGLYREAMGELGCMGAMLEQMGRAVHQTADRIEEADQAAVGFFGDVGAGEKAGSRPPGLAAPLPPSEIPPWERDGFGWWAEAFEREHGRPPTEEEYEEFRLSWELSGQGQVQWTDADWEAFYYAREAGLEKWMGRGVVFAGAWTGAQILAAVLSLNAVQQTWGDETEVMLGLEDGLELTPPPAGEEFTLLPVLGEKLNPGFEGAGTVKEHEAGGGTVEYGLLEGQTELFIDGGDGVAIHPSDVTQGRLGDCYFMSSLAALAGTDEGRALLERNIRANPDGTYTVTLYERNADSGALEPVEVTVTPEFPLTEGGDPFFARRGDVLDAGTPDRSDDRVELWPQVYEKAYAQHFGEYGSIEGGWGAGAMETLTGQPSTGYVIVADLPFGIEPGEFVGQHFGSTTWVPESVEFGTTFDEFVTHFDEGSAMTAGTWPIPEDETTIDVSIPGLDLRVNPLALIVSEVYDDPRVMGCHEYYVVDVDPSTRTVFLRNPHDYGQAIIPVGWTEFKKAFPVVSVNPIEP